MVSNWALLRARCATFVALLMLNFGLITVAKANTTEANNDLTLYQAIQLALQNNPGYAASMKEIDALEGGVLQAGTWRNPELAVDAEDIGASQADGLQRYTTVRLSQVIELGGKRDARIKTASLTQDIARHDSEVKRTELLMQVADAFIDVLAAQERIKLAHESVQLAQKVVSAAQKRVQAGKAPPIEETKAKVALSTAAIEMQQAQRDLNTSRTQLTLLWGNPTPQFEQASGNLTTQVNLPAFEVLVEQVRQGPMAQRSVKAVEQRQAILELERSQRVPNINVNAGIRRFSQFGGNTTLLGVAVPLPLFDRNQGNVKEAWQRLGKAEDEQASTTLRLQSDLARTYDALLAAQQETNGLRDEILPAAQLAFNTANRGYELGKFAFLDVLDAQRTLFYNQMLYLRALVNYQKRVNELERLIAKPISSEEK